MLISFWADNYRCFRNEVCLDLKTDTDSPRFADSRVKCPGTDVWRNAVIFGANGSGKTDLMWALREISLVMSGLNITKFDENPFTKNPIVNLGCEFILDGRRFIYDFKFDTTPKYGGFVYEKLTEIVQNAENGENGETKQVTIFERDKGKGIYTFKDNPELGEFLRSINDSALVLYAINDEKYPEIGEYRHIFGKFTQNLVVLDYNMLKNLDGSSAVFFKETNSNRSLALETVKVFLPNVQDVIVSSRELSEDVVLVVKNGKAFHWVELSDGERTLITLAGYITDALVGGKTLFFDNFGEGIHFKINYMVMVYFQCLREHESQAQLICTTNDLILMNTRLLFSWEQIWLLCESKKINYLYSVSQISDGVYEEDDLVDVETLVDKYWKGHLGPVPNMAGDKDLMDINFFSEEENEE